MFQMARSTALALKLFGEAMFTHKESELFTELRPPFFAFMKKLKASLKAA